MPRPPNIPTFTLEALPDEPPQHLPTLIAEGRRLVGVDVQHVGTDLEVLGCGESWREQATQPVWNKALMMSLLEPFVQHCLVSGKTEICAINCALKHWNISIHLHLTESGAGCTDGSCRTISTALSKHTNSCTVRMDHWSTGSVDVLYIYTFVHPCSL